MEGDINKVIYPTDSQVTIMLPLSHTSCRRIPDPASSLLLLLPAPPAPQGHICGRGAMSDRPLLLMFDLTQCLNPAVLVEGCLTPQVIGERAGAIAIAGGKAAGGAGADGQKAGASSCRYVSPPALKSPTPHLWPSQQERERSR